MHFFFLQDHVTTFPSDIGANVMTADFSPAVSIELSKLNIVWCLQLLQAGKSLCGQNIMWSKHPSQPPLYIPNYQITHL